MIIQLKNNNRKFYFFVLDYFLEGWLPGKEPGRYPNVFGSVDQNDVEKSNWTGHTTNDHQ